jgi:alkanesulfonate monooxygenase SsuD/methylene tetrahydromethanopterin reductase-like flavin-dependent oxidoreductase (luciferase family)
MRLGAALFPRGAIEAGRQGAMPRLLAWARHVEAAGFDGIWMPDSLGRGRPSLDPLLGLAAIAAATRRVELGTAVLQVPLRSPIELAHRIQSLDLLSEGRLRLGVGAGSTRADFALLGADYDRRFETLEQGLAIMRRVWRGEDLGQGTLSPVPGTEAGPPLLIGSWRSARWIDHAARRFDGWIASGIYSSWEDLAAGMRRFRAAGGKRAILANVPVDLREPHGASPEMAKAPVGLVCPPAEARERIARIAALGFDDLLVIGYAEAPDHGTGDQLDAIRRLV